MGKLMRIIYCGGCRYLNREAKLEAETWSKSHCGSCIQANWALRSGRSSKQGLCLKMPVPCNSDWNGSKSLLGDMVWVYSSKNWNKPQNHKHAGQLSLRGVPLPVCVTVVVWFGHFSSLPMAANPSVPHHAQRVRSYNLWVPEVCAERGNWSINWHIQGIPCDITAI